MPNNIKKPFRRRPPILVQGDGKNIRTEYSVETIHPPHKSLFCTMKRLIDLVSSLLGFIVFFIPMLIIALCIRIDSPGKAIYKQERLGKNGKPFMLYKFRSMWIDAEANGAVWASENDERITRVGKFLRHTRMDELPQLWNIFLGQMSIVGPRPERSFFYDQFEEYVHGFKQRLYVTPGLTGWAQVNGGDDLLPGGK
ncbi:MAG TPA: UDP-phosphate N-acetylgalactosaminyl-1-phosphate transferase, partial [Clostridiales bacterium]|nr:UDP-phosphate N-acetylgalactosaminyl-1-phosphate transferase [Clostridiales bacterium]